MSMSEYKIGDRFHDRTQRERKVKEFEITRVDDSGFTAVDLNEPDINKWAGRTKYCYPNTAIRAMESQGDFEWQIRNGKTQ